MFLQRDSVAECTDNGQLIAAQVLDGALKNAKVFRAMNRNGFANPRSLFHSYSVSKGKYVTGQRTQITGENGTISLCLAAGFSFFRVLRASKLTTEVGITFATVSHNTFDSFWWFCLKIKMGLHTNN